MNPLMNALMPGEHNYQQGKPMPGQMPMQQPQPMMQPEQSEPAKRGGFLGGVGNVLGTVLKYGAPEAYEQGRQQKLNRNLGNALADGNYEQGAQEQLRAGNIDQGLAAREMGQEQQATQRKQEAQGVLQLFTSLQPAQVTQYAMEDPAGFERMTGMSSDEYMQAGAKMQQMGIPPEKFAQMVISKAQAELGQAPAEPTKGVTINGKLVNPQTGEMMGDFSDPAPRRIVRGADGNDYYEDTQERVLPNVQAPRQTQERVTPGDTRPVSLGEGQYATYNPATQRWDVSGGGGGFGGQMPTDPQTFNADTGTSPFDSLGTYQGGKLIQARYDGEGFGGGHGGGQGGPDMGQQGDFTEMSPGGRKPTDFDKTQDREVAKDIADWKTSGQANAMTNLTRLKSVIATLRDPNKNTTGPVIGAMPGRKMFAGDSVNAQQTAEAAVQGSLKAILGGQFAQAEAEALFNRTYDPQLSEEVNAQRLELLYNDLVNRARLNEGLARYADQYGTTQGFKGYLPGLQDFGQERAETTSGPAALGAAEPARAPFGGMVKRGDYEKTATNPQTGEKIGLRNGQWEPIQ